ncbi:Aste57867_5226 [Aphanomyces stellatus]|uniref:Aste57867_5226 protein n=1 Tax=Aphanomyces stellatus TaxID=120398 RepID=A0A485KF85_9STRA|nr:hypothetical protein As57867_005213 [Aphanomyces stellatus]VFT82299.1 Aste57867_5226 [Aphanomyces stellatus]
MVAAVEHKDPTVMMTARIFTYRNPVRNCIYILALLYAASFAVTYYRGWWDTLVGLLVTLVGIAALLYPLDNGSVLLDVFYWATFGTIGLHVLAIGLISQDLIQTDINFTLGLPTSFQSENGIWNLYLAIIAVISVQIIAAAVTLNYCHRLRVEIAGNILLTHSDYTDLSTL